jgi:hypothetical protein
LPASDATSTPEQTIDGQRRRSFPNTLILARATYDILEGWCKYWANPGK